MQEHDKFHVLRQCVDMEQHNTRTKQHQETQCTPFIIAFSNEVRIQPALSVLFWFK
jgi:hypothetical protein